MDQCVVGIVLQGDVDIGCVFGKEFVELVGVDEFDGSGLVLFDFFFFMQEVGGWQYDVVEVVCWIVQCIFDGEGWMVIG